MFFVMPRHLNGASEQLKHLKKLISLRIVSNKSFELQMNFYIND